MLFNNKEEFKKLYVDRLTSKYGKSPADAHIYEKYDVLIDNLNNLNKILQELNVNELGTIVKERTTYVYKNKYEFSFDNVESIGLFIEIEVINQIDNFEKDTYNLVNLMKELKIDLNMIERRKYIDYLVKD